jgi:hypothetical protein
MAPKKPRQLLVKIHICTINFHNENPKFAEELQIMYYVIDDKIPLISISSKSYFNYSYLRNPDKDMSQKSLRGDYLVS